MYRQMNTGEKRLLIGSREFMGVGVNMQNRLGLVVQLDLPFTFAMLEQSIGRAVRQGNQNKKVEVLTVVSKKTAAATMFEMLYRKMNVAQLLAKWTADDVFEVPDFGTDELESAFVAAALSGDPKKFRLVRAEQQLKELSDKRALFVGQQQAAEKMLIKYEYEVPILKDQLKEVEGFEKQAQPTTADKFKITLEDKEYKNRKDVHKPFWQILSSSPDNEIRVDGEWKPYSIGKLGNLDIFASTRPNVAGGLRGTVKIAGRFIHLTRTDTASTILRRMEHTINKELLGGDIKEGIKNRIESFESEKKLNQEIINITFPQQKEYDEAKNNYARVQSEVDESPLDPDEQYSTGRFIQNRFNANIGEIIEQVSEIVHRIFPDVNGIHFADALYGYGPRLLESQRAAGRQLLPEDEVAGYANRAQALVAISLDSKFDQIDTAYHEAYHLARGYLNDDEKAVLRDEFRTEEEEAIAFAEYNTTYKAKTNIIKEIFKKLAELFKRVGNFLRGLGFNSVESIFNEIELGYIGRRQVKARSENEMFYSAKRPTDRNRNIGDTFQTKVDPKLVKWIGELQVAKVLQTDTTTVPETLASVNELREAVSKGIIPDDLRGVLRLAPRAMTKIGLFIRDVTEISLRTAIAENIKFKKNNYDLDAAGGLVKSYAMLEWSATAFKTLASDAGLFMRMLKEPINPNSGIDNLGTWEKTLDMLRKESNLTNDAVDINGIKLSYKDIADVGGIAHQDLKQEREEIFDDSGSTRSDHLYDEIELLKEQNKDYKNALEERMNDFKDAEHAEMMDKLNLLIPHIKEMSQRIENMTSKKMTVNDMSEMYSGESVFKRYHRYLMAIYYGTLLSNPLTTAVNITGALVMMLAFKPTAQVFGSWFLRSVYGDKFLDTFSRTGDEFAGMFRVKLRRLGSIYMDALLKGELLDTHTAIDVATFFSPIKAFDDMRWWLPRNVLKWAYASFSSSIVAVDTAAKHIAITRTLYMYGMQHARRMKLEGDEKKAFVKQFLESPDPFSLAFAIEEGRQVTYSTRTTSASIRSVRHLRDRAGLAGAAVFPFFYMLWNNLRESTKLSPATAWVFPENRAELLGKRGKYKQGEIVGLMSFGFVAFLPWIFKGVTEGFITGAGPGEPEERKIWLIHNKPYSIKISGQWYSYRQFWQPFGLAIGFWSSLAEDYGAGTVTAPADRDLDFDDKQFNLVLIDRWIRTILRTPSEAIGGGNIEAIFSTLSRTREYSPHHIKRYSTDFLSGAGTHGLSRYFKQWVDPYSRHAITDEDGYWINFRNNWKSKNVVASNSMPLRYDVLGLPIRTSKNFEMFIGLEGKKPETDEDIKRQNSQLIAYELSRLGFSRFNLRTPTESDGVELDMWERSYLEYSRGMKLRMTLQALMSESEYKDSDDDGKRILIKAAWEISNRNMPSTKQLLMYYDRDKWVKANLLNKIMDRTGHAKRMPGGAFRQEQ